MVIAPIVAPYMGQKKLSAFVHEVIVEFCFSNLPLKCCIM